MQHYFLGEAIKKRRQELGLTQEQLCEGICEPITISRLENGKQTPSRNRINALLERLDMPADRYHALLSKNELEVDALQREIASYNARFEKATSDEKPQIREMALNAHKKLEAISDNDDTLSRQLILRSRVVIGTENGPYSVEEKVCMLTEALRITSPRFDISNIGCGLYTTDEIKIINHLALVYSHAGECLTAIEIWGHLRKYIQTHFHNIPLIRAHLNMVLLNYTRELNIIGQYQKAIEIAEEGRQICLDYGHYLSLPGLLALQAECYHRLGENDKSRDLFHQAYYLTKAIGDNNNLQRLKRKAKEQLNLEFEF